MGAHVGQSTRIKDSAGKVWTLSRQERRHTRAFEEWARPQVKDPRAVALSATLDLAKEEVAIRKRTDLEPDEKQAMIEALQRQQAVYSKEAMSLAAGELSIDHPQVQSLLRSTEGTCEMLRLLMADAHPDATADDAFALLSDVGQELIEQSIVKAQGTAPKDAAPVPAAGAP